MRRSNTAEQLDNTFLSLTERIETLNQMMDDKEVFSEVTGGRPLAFRDLSVGEIPPEAGREAKLPHR
jgi:hypothetical protein